MEIAGLKLGGSGGRLSRSRTRILAAASDLLKTEPREFSVQRVARRAGISARAVYGHFSSGAELAATARLSTLQAVVAKLPTGISATAAPAVALGQFALGISAAIRSQGSTWLMSSRQDEIFRRQYRRCLRQPLVRELELYLIGLKPGGRFGPYTHGRLAEMFVTTIEGLIVNHEPDLALQVELDESIEWAVNTFCRAHAL